MTNEQAIEYKDARIRAALATLTDLDEKTTEKRIVCLDAVNAHLVEALYGKPEPTLSERRADPTTSPEISPDSQAIEQARAVLKAASSPASLPIWQVRIAIVTDAHGVYVVISHDDQPLFTSRHVAIDRLIEAFEDAAQFAEHGMPYDDGGSALMSVRDWIARLSVMSDLRRVLGVTQ